METEETYEQAMLSEARRQTTALEALRNFALLVLLLAGIGLLIGLVAAFA